MSVPAGEPDDLRRLEADVRAELYLAESRNPGESVPAPADEQYELRLHSLLDAVVALEGDAQPDGRPA
ncbi:hypothetical protein GCM10010399_74730 [Dactylosporangium fulvum]|uniref:Uncharacterized protein n=1 Tax=Dactylosporangium fulvum TaxID=53359 RepID=A0ABY5VRJ5_9ACTN|nr:hypothetical protein [Dactylosporangium fulvum]UWP79108.1 hypothetical protein Dfulv_28515 [Dactylosporangium fulvum]